VFHPVVIDEPEPFSNGNAGDDSARGRDPEPVAFTHLIGNSETGFSESFNPLSAQRRRDATIGFEVSGAEILPPASALICCPR
jgi:hypothetical protein